MITDDGKALALTRLLTGTWHIVLTTGSTILETQEWDFTVTTGVAVGSTNVFTLASRTTISTVYLTDNNIILATQKINKVYPAGASLQVKCNLHF